MDNPSKDVLYHVCYLMVLNRCVRGFGLKKQLQSFAKGIYQDPLVHSSNTLHRAASAVGSAVNCATWPGTGCMSQTEKRGRVPSRQWSCSDMVKGHKELVKAKKEHESDEELEAQIKDYFHQILIFIIIINML